MVGCHNDTCTLSLNAPLSALIFTCLLSREVYYPGILGKLRGRAFHRCPDERPSPLARRVTARVVKKTFLSAALNCTQFWDGFLLKVDDYNRYNSYNRYNLTYITYMLYQCRRQSRIPREAPTHPSPGTICQKYFSLEIRTIKKNMRQQNVSIKKKFETKKYFSKCFSTQFDEICSKTTSSGC